MNTKESKARHMNIGEIKEALHHTANNCKQLADKLGDSGKALTDTDKELIRLSFLPQFRDMIQDATYGFVVGNLSTVENILNHVKDFIDSFDY
ncbi:MAG: hypothetical protein KAR20_00545 [Candidatus Heimdallarchaeota archaeon]|nr:hypothetical protein [Candidatus Heimdallarchaeota archaeon]